MYPAILFIHSWVRWLALVAGVGATSAGLSNADGRLRGAERWGLVLMIALDIQMLLGLLLYVAFSPFVSVAMSGFAAAMRDRTLRFWAVEHVTMMFAAVILVHVGRVLVRKATRIEQRRTRLLVCFGLAVLAMLAGMPWPGLPYGRPLIPTYPAL